MGTGDMIHSYDIGTTGTSTSPFSGAIKGYTVYATHEEAVKEDTFVCGGCGETLPMHKHYEDEMCEECWLESHFICDSCGGEYSNDYYGGDGMCQDCFETYLEEQEEEHDKPEPPPQPQVPIKWFFPGDKVRIKKGLAELTYGTWSSAMLSQDGVVLSSVKFSSDGKPYVGVNFPCISHWNVLPSELVCVKKSKPAWWYKNKGDFPDGKCCICGSTKNVMGGCPDIDAPHCLDCCGEVSKLKIKVPPHLKSGYQQVAYNPPPSPVRIARTPPEGYVSLTEIEDGNCPIPSSESLYFGDVCTDWNIDRSIKLYQVASDFYLLEDLFIDFPEDEEVVKHRTNLTELLADQFSSYINMIVGGELRYVKEEIDAQCGGYFPEGELTPTVVKLFQWLPQRMGKNSRTLEWRRWKDFQEQEDVGTILALETAVNLFNSRSCGWGGSIGGKQWAVIANTVLMYLKGETSATTFIDTAFGLQHNHSIMFDKVWGEGVRDLSYILTENQNGNMELLECHASVGIKELRKRLKG